MEPGDFIDPCIPIDPHGTQGKVFRDGKGLLVKDMRGGSPEKVRREYNFQCAVYRQVQQVPKPIRCNSHFIVMEDLGEDEPITDMRLCSERAENLLQALKEAGVRHNDLRRGNVLIKDNTPYALDFGWAQWMIEAPYENQPTDREALFAALVNR